MTSTNAANLNDYISEAASRSLKPPAVPHRTLEERLTAFYGKPLDEIGRIDSEEFDWGPAKGAECLSPTTGGKRGKCHA